MSTPSPVPTQVKRPWRATARTAFAGVVGFAALLPFIIQATGLDPEVYPWLAGVLAIAAAVTRIMALPQVEAFLQRFVPFLSAAPKAQILGKAVAGDLPPTVEKPGGMQARRNDTPEA